MLSRVTVLTRYVQSPVSAWGSVSVYGEPLRTARVKRFVKGPQMKQMNTDEKPRGLGSCLHPVIWGPSPVKSLATEKESAGKPNYGQGENGWLRDRACVVKHESLKTDQIRRWSSTSAQRRRRTD